MSETTTKTRRAPQKRAYGMILSGLRLFIPVDTKNLRNQIAVSECVEKAQVSGDLSEILQLPGVRMDGTSFAPRFGSIAPAGAAPVPAEGDDTLTSSDTDEKGEGDGPTEEQPADGSEESAPEHVNNRKGRRAA